MGIVHAKEAFSTREKINEANWKPFNEVSARVDKVHFEGIKRTKEDVLLYISEHLLHADNFQEILLRAHSVRQQLQSLNAYKNIDIILDTSQGTGATSNGYEVTFDVEERAGVTGNISALVGQNEGSLLFRFLFPNVLGRGESIHADYQYGKKTSGFSLTSTKPIFHWVNPTTNQVIYSQTTERPYSGYQEQLKGLNAEISFESSPQVLHTLRWEGVWRNLRCISASTPFEIREQSGHSLKSSIKHILTMDQRDDPRLPLKGCFFQLYQEYAGLGGNVNFLKHEIQYQVNKVIYGDLVFQATLLGGLIRSLLSDRTVRINDRFFLGGPLSIRGFAMDGLGPHTENHSTGAEAYWAGGLHAYAPLPFRPLRRVLDHVCRTHAFLNVGNIGNFSFTDDYHQNMVMLLSHLRWSCGAGLVLKVGGIARFELNYCLPLSSEPTDRLNKGLQFGIGVTFL